MIAPVIAIDGPAASGKGTLARGLADRLGFACLDTGALYRAVALRILEAGMDPADPQACAVQALAFAESFDPSMLQHPDIRTQQTGEAASRVSAVPAVRDALLDFQRHFAFHPPEGKKGSVLDGRDIGTVVCPDAPVKLFVTARPEIRARRRMEELQLRGIAVTYEAVLRQTHARDARDADREVAPLKPAEDACMIDTSDLSREDVLERALGIVRERLGSSAA